MLEHLSWLPPETVTPAGTHGKSIDARGADWSGLSLGSLDLSSANLCRADLEALIFICVNLIVLI